MYPERWQRIQGIFAAARAVDGAARDAYLAHACAGDAALLAELLVLLAHDAASDGGVERIVSDAASALMKETRRRVPDGWIGRRLGAWRITAHLADGGMGAVFRAERADGQYQQQAAIKLISPAFFSRQAAERLAAERQILASLNHPHVARLLDGGSDIDGAPYLVMEYVDGVPIDDYCNTQGLDTAARLRLFLRVCEAVDYAHRNLVVHRDIKPSNLLVAADGTPKLLDFGISKLLDAADPALTAANQRLFTPARASPEQVSGGPITTATDVYALGVLLYELLSGSLPFAAAGRTSAQIAQDILHTEPARPSVSVARSSTRLEAARRRGDALTADQLRRELDGDLDNIVLMALRKEPTRRYASVQALADDVRAVLEHRPVAARADTLAYRTGKFVRRHRLGVALAAGALLTIASVVGFSTWRLATERDRALAAERSMRRTADFTASLLVNTAPARGGAREVSVLDLLDRAVQRVDEELRDEPDVAARLRSALGSAYSGWQQFDKSIQQLELALPILLAQDPPPHATIADLLNALFLTTHGLGQYETALKWAREAEQAYRLADLPIQHALAQTYVGVVLNDMRRPHEAIPHFLAALAAFRAATPGDHEDIAYTINMFALALHGSGRLQEALPHFNEALAMQRRLQVQPLDVATTLGNLGLLRRELGDLDAAEAAWRECVAIHDRIYGALRSTEGIFRYAHLAQLAALRGDRERSLTMSDEALRALIDLHGPDHIRTAEMMRNRAEVLLLAGRVGEARALYQRSLDLSRRQLRPGHADLARTLYGLARAELALDDRVRGERALREALAVIEALDQQESSPRDPVTLLLAQILARGGDRQAAAELGARAIERMDARLPPNHYLLLAARAQVLLPPFVEVVTPEGEAIARASIERLAHQLSSDSPLVRALAASLPARVGAPTR